MKYYMSMSKKQKTIFHLVVLSIMALIFIFVDPTDNTTMSSIASLIFTILLIIELVIYFRYRKDKKKVQKQKDTENSKQEYVKYYESAPYNHENWLRVFGYKRNFNVIDEATIESVNNKDLKIDFIDSELIVYHNDNMIGKLNDADLISHVRDCWEDEDYQILPLIQEIGYKSRTAKLQVNFFKKIQLIDNPKVKTVETKLIKVDESQDLIEQIEIGTYLKVYRDEDKASRFYVANKYGDTLGDVKSEVAKLIDEYFDSGYVIVRMKNIIDEVDHTDALVEFFFIQKNV